MSIYRQPYEKHDCRGGLDSGLVYYLLRKYAPPEQRNVVRIVFDQFPGGNVIREVCQSLALAYGYTNFPEATAQETQTPSEATDLVLSHPPYWSAKKYTDDPNDLANCKTYEEFIGKLCDSIDEAERILKVGGYLIFICGDYRKEKVLYPIHSDIIQYTKKHDNFILRDYVFWEISASSTPMIGTEWMLMGNFCLVWEKVSKKSGTLDVF